MLKNSLRRRPTLAHKAVVAALLLVLAGCAAANPTGSSGNDKANGLYGGVSGGWARP